MKVTTKGQVTIPIDVRTRLGIQPGTEVEFRIEDDAVRLIPLKKPLLRGRRIVARMRGRGTVRMTTDEIMALTRGEA